MLDGDFCVTRVTLGTPSEVEKNLAMLATRVPRYLSLGPGEKITGGYRLQINRKTEYAVTSVANRRVIETLHHCAYKSDLEFASIEPTMVAVARVLGRFIPSPAPILLADGSGSQWDVGIVDQGHLLLDYRPSATRENEGLTETLRQHMPRLHRFCQRHLHLEDSKLEELYLYGPPQKVASASAGVTQDTQRDSIGIRARAIDCSQWLPPDIQIPDGANDPNWMGAVAAACTCEGLADVPVLADLQSSVRMRRHRSASQQVLRALAPVIAAASLLMPLHWYTRYTSNERAALHTELANLQETWEQWNTLSRTLRTDSTILDAYEIAEAKLHARAEMQHVLEWIPQCLPDSARLLRLQLNPDGTVQITGTAISESTIYAFSEHLREIPGVIDVQLQGTTPGGSLRSQTKFGLLIRTQLNVNAQET